MSRTLSQIASPTLCWSPRLAAVMALSLVTAPSARGELGAAGSSVALDQVKMRAQAKSVSMGRYDRHDLTRPNGGMVHEFTNADGKVFAVSWAGPGKPDLRSLLGNYFVTFQAGSASIGRAMHSLRRPPQVDKPDIQIQTAGHMGWFRGVAFVPSLAPAGVTVNTIPVTQ